MSATFNHIKPASMERAIAKARQLKPRVHVNGFNDFTVSGSKGDSYSVKFTGKGLDFTAHCTCTGSQNGNACYHSAAAAPIMKLQTLERAAEKAAAATCGECGTAVPAGCDLCTPCYDILLACGQIEAPQPACQDCGGSVDVIYLQKEGKHVCVDCMTADLFGGN